MNQVRSDLPRRLVVVGADGSALSLDAAAWAAREAGVRDLPLLVVHAHIWPLLNVPAIFAGLGPADGLREYAEQVVEEAVKVAKAVAPELHIQTLIETSFPLPLLVELSNLASFVVVGSRGLGPLGGLLAGSTATDLIARAHCPVVITHGLPGNSEDTRPVVLGIDGSPENSPAVGVALDVAATHRRSVLAVYVVQSPANPEGGETTGAAATDVLRRGLSGWTDKYPDVTVEQRVVPGHPGGVLSELSRGASVTVVGSRGRGGFKGMLLGSVSQTLCHYVHSPLIVVPPKGDRYGL